MDFDKDVLEKSTLKKQEEIDKFIKNLEVKSIKNIVQYIYIYIYTNKGKIKEK